MSDVQVRRIATVAALAALALFIAIRVYCTHHYTNRGWATTCHDLLGMTSSQRLDVMKRAGVDPAHRSAAARFNVAECRHDPEMAQTQIGDIGP